MKPAERLLHEVIIRALQMVLNSWKKYLDERKLEEPQEPSKIRTD